MASSCQENEKLPMILAMKGPSSNEKSRIAIQLAGYFHYPLIDEEDIIPNLQTSLSTSFTNPSVYLDDLPFQIVSQISSTQLKLKLGVVINAALSQPSHIDHLTTFKEASLITIECVNRINQTNDHSCHINEDFAKIDIIVNTARPFVLDELVPLILRAHKKVENFQVIEDAPEKIISQDGDIIPQEIYSQAHAHEFWFTEEPKVGSNKLYCNYCNQVISGPTYECIECNMFNLHKSCAELPSKLKLLWKNCPSYLTDDPPKYNFPETHKCKFCESFSYNCNHCLLQTQIKCGFLPTILNYEQHIHPFNFVIMPFWFNYEYKCFACDKLGKSISYKCYECCLDLHTNCAIHAEEEAEKAKTNEENEKIQTSFKEKEYFPSRGNLKSPVRKGKEYLPSRGKKPIHVTERIRLKSAIDPMIERQLNELLRRYNTNGDDKLSWEELNAALELLDWHIRLRDEKRNLSGFANTLKHGVLL